MENQQDKDRICIGQKTFSTGQKGHKMGQPGYLIFEFGHLNCTKWDNQVI